MKTASGGWLLKFKVEVFVKQLHKPLSPLFQTSVPTDLLLLVGLALINPLHGDSKTRPVLGNATTLLLVAMSYVTDQFRPREQYHTHEGTTARIVQRFVRAPPPSENDYSAVKEQQHAKGRYYRIKFPP